MGFENKIGVHFTKDIFSPEASGYYQVLVQWSTGGLHRCKPHVYKCRNGLYGWAF